MATTIAEIVSIDDGRNIDPQLGTLSGEGAQQLTPSAKYDLALQSQSFPYVPSHQNWGSPIRSSRSRCKRPAARKRNRIRCG